MLHNNRSLSHTQALNKEASKCFCWRNVLWWTETTSKHASPTSTDAAGELPLQHSQWHMWLNSYALRYTESPDGFMTQLLSKLSAWPCNQFQIADPEHGCKRQLGHRSPPTCTGPRCASQQLKPTRPPRTYADSWSPSYTMYWIFMRLQRPLNEKTLPHA